MSDRPTISQAIKDKLAELVILLDQENAAGQANVGTCAILFGIPGAGVMVQISGDDSGDRLELLQQALAMHAAGVQPQSCEQILPPKARVN